MIDVKCVCLLCVGEWSEKETVYLFAKISEDCSVVKNFFWRSLISSLFVCFILLKKLMD